jgi:isoleucyl-tRNA synthetase
MTPQHIPEEGWVSAAENGTQVFLDVHRDQKLLGEGAMRDLARRVQALRKELGYMPTDILDDVYMAELDNETVQLLQPYLQEMKELIRARNIHLLVDRGETGTDWHESQLDERKVYIAIRAQNKKPSI